MKNKSFDKFINHKSNAAKKEEFRQQKRKIKQELRARKEQRLRHKPNNFNEQNESAADKTKITFKDSSDKNKSFYKKKSAADNRQNLHNTSPDKSSEKKFRNTNLSLQGKPELSQKAGFTTQLMPLNKYVAHAGICGRREAAEMVKAGKVKVNNEVVTEPGYKVKTDDKITVNGKSAIAQKNLIYILLNKPKDYITTTADPEGRKTVFELIKNASDERVFPVGRLDRNTTGILLLTNDGELTQKLTHPSFQVKKIYEVKLDKPLLKPDMEAIAKGFELEDGFIAADSVGYADAKDKSIVGIEIHSGRNRIVRRMFEHLGYNVRNLDRVLFANLTKKNVERGKWRLLKEKEIRLLKYMNQSFIKKEVNPKKEIQPLHSKNKHPNFKRTRPEK